MFTHSEMFDLDSPTFIAFFIWAPLPLSNHRNHIRSSTFTREARNFLYFPWSSWSCHVSRCIFELPEALICNGKCYHWNSSHGTNTFEFILKDKYLPCLFHLYLLFLGACDEGPQKPIEKLINYLYSITNWKYVVSPLCVIINLLYVSLLKKLAVRAAIIVK